MATKPVRLLLVDDDPLLARLLKANLDRGGRVRVDLASSGERALEELVHQPYDAVLTDLVMPGLDGLGLLERIRSLDPSLPVMVFTAHATFEGAVEAIRAGATEFLPKPVNVEALLALIERAVVERPVREELAVRLRTRGETALEERLVGAHPRLDEVREFARQVARIPGARVLITGETGTGKSALARALHDLSEAGGRFVEVNCAAIPDGLLESELFGHERGAFTDAKALKRGLVELAHEGTLFLDEIGAMPLELQAKLLAFLENQEVRRVGGASPIPVTTRVVAATNEDLQARVREKSFRMDLLYRLDVASVEMPPLRSMREVVLELAGHFTRTLSAEMKRSVPELGPDSFTELPGYRWPGNARELKNCVERALIFHREGRFHVTPPPGRGDGGSDGGGLPMPAGLTLEEVERRYLEAALAEVEDRPLEEVARELGISRKTLWEKRRRFGL